MPNPEKTPKIKVPPNPHFHSVPAPYHYTLLLLLSYSPTFYCHISRPNLESNTTLSRQPDEQPRPPQPAQKRGVQYDQREWTFASKTGTHHGPGILALQLWFLDLNLLHGEVA
jgi:hypothetical protein